MVTEMSICLHLHLFYILDINIGDKITSIIPFETIVGWVLIRGYTLIPWGCFIDNHVSEMGAYLSGELI